jgi:hypothetical protein
MLLFYTPITWALDLSKRHAVRGFEYVGLKDRKEAEEAENYVRRSFIICILYIILLG